MAKLNPVALEVPVIATGARPGSAAGKRELFTEATSSVVVFENGGVIRLSAAVAAGQLLFLTHQETKREVVAQVTRKRAFRPTSCFVELEFTESAAGFWGIEFPARSVAEPVAPSPQEAAAAEMLESSAPIEYELVTPAPSEQEVDVLRQEVEALREQLRTFVETPASGAATESVNAASLNATKVSGVTPAAMEDDEVAETAGAGGVENRGAEKSAEMDAVVAGMEEAPALPQIPRQRTVPMKLPTAKPTAESDEGLLPAPDLNLAKNSGVAIGSAASKASKSSGALRTGLLCAALLAVAAGGAWHEGLIPGMAPKKISGSGANAVNVAKPASTATTTRSALAAGHPVGEKSGGAAVTPVAGGTSASSPASAGSTQIDAAGRTGAGDTAEDRGRVAESAPTSGADAARMDAAEKPSVNVTSSARRNVSARSTVKPADTGSTVVADSSEIVAPKLIKSVRAVAPPEALRGFVTGNVSVDALVDASGRVTVAKALSGPEVLRGAAITAAKQYEYAPATLHGKAVSAHVKVAVQFWYEP
jgi:hypothetical protein